MIKVEICACDAEQPLANFIDRTTRLVCLPGLQNGRLYVRVEQPSFLCIEVGGEQVLALPLRQGGQSFPLSDLLTPASPKRRSTPAFLTQLVDNFPLPSNKASERPASHAFTAVIRADGPNGSVLGTFGFELLNEAEFDRKQALQLGERRPKTTSAPFSHDARCASTTKYCWNCNQPLDCACESCGHCGAMQES